MRLRLISRFCIKKLQWSIFLIKCIYLSSQYSFIGFLNMSISAFPIILWQNQIKTLLSFPVFPSYRFNSKSFVTLADTRAAITPNHTTRTVKLTFVEICLFSTNLFLSILLKLINNDVGYIWCLAKNKIFSLDISFDVHFLFLFIISF